MAVIPTFVLEPRKGFGPATLGSSREDVRQAMSAAGFPLERSRKHTDHFSGSAIQIECDDNDRVHFIGVSYSPRFNATYRGTLLFGVDAEQLFRLIADADSSGEHEFA